MLLRRQRVPSHPAHIHPRPHPPHYHRKCPYPKGGHGSRSHFSLLLVFSVISLDLAGQGVCGENAFDCCSYHFTFKVYYVADGTKMVVIFPTLVLKWCAESFIYTYFSTFEVM